MEKPSYEKGVRHAKYLMTTEPIRFDYWLDRTRRGRRKLLTMLLRPRKRKFLAGLEDGLMQYQKRRDAQRTATSIAAEV